MKKCYTLSLLLAVCLWQGCDTRQQQTANTDMMVLIDRTDSLRDYPTVKSILEPLDVQHNKWRGIRITFSAISDKDLNDRIVVELPPQSEWNGNIVEREAQIRLFIKQVQSALDNMRSLPTCTHSIVYRAIARDANSLTASHATNKYLLVYSDLYENNDDLNFYRLSFIRELKQTPDKVERRIIKSMPLESLAHIKIWLLYNPTSFADNNRFMPIAELYKHLFENHGAQVHIATTFELP